MTSFNYTAYCGAVDQFPGWPSKLQECFSQYHMFKQSSFETHCAADLHQRISDLLSNWPCTIYGKDWLDVLYRPIFELAQSKWWWQLSKQGYLAFPATKDIFNFARYCSPREVKVVIVGQDPYPNENAHGLAFSVQGGEIPPSLNNIFKLLERTIPSFEAYHGNLTPWAEQGVLLLNSVLTYPRGCYISHMGQGCEIFTNAVIEYIDENNEYVVFMLWGEEAKAKSKLIKNASGSWDKTIKLWNIRSGNCIHTCNGHIGWVQAVTFSPDGTYVASASDDETVRVWDVINGKCVKTLEGQTDQAHQCGFTPGGALVASGAAVTTLALT